MIQFLQSHVQHQSHYWSHTHQSIRPANKHASPLKQKKQTNCFSICFAELCSQGFCSLLWPCGWGCGALVVDEEGKLWVRNRSDWIYELMLSAFLWPRLKNIMVRVMGTLHTDWYSCLVSDSEHSSTAESWFSLNEPRMMWKEFPQMKNMKLTWNKWGMKLIYELLVQMNFGVS